MVKYRFNDETMSLMLDYSDHIRPMDEIRKQVTNAIQKDREGKIRAVLIEMGWTPPEHG